jgi:hypothetical protein
MKKAKMFMVLALMSLVATSVQAQDDEMPLKTFRVGLFGGVNISNITVDIDHTSRVGYNVGLMAEFNPLKFLYVNAQASIVQRGVVFEKFSQIQYTSGSKAGQHPDIEATPCYFMFAPHVGLRAFVNKRGKTPLSIYGEFGPYYAIGFTGSFKDKNREADKKWKYFKESREVIDEHIETNKNDFGLTGEVGVEIGNVCKVGLRYDHGLTKAFKVDDGWTAPKFEDAKNRSYSLQIAVLL